MLLLALSACKEENKYEPPPAPKVGVAQPVKRPVTRYLELTGNTVSLDKVELVARASGFLQQINYKDGSMVKKGDVLFIIEPAPYEAKVLQEEAGLAAAKAAADYAEAEFQRQYALSQTTQFGWQSKFYEAQRNRDEKRAELQKAQAGLELAKIELGYTRVTAPFDGIVTTHLAAIGALVGGGSSPTALATILRLDPIYVVANFSEQDVLRIIADPSGISTADLGKIPIELKLMNETGYPHKGVIDYIAPQVDASTGTLRVRGVLANPDYALVPGLFARVRVPPSQGPEQEALLVPKTALGSDQAGRYVMVVDKDNIVDGGADADAALVEEGGARIRESDIEKLTVKSAAGKMVPIGALAQIEPTVGPAVITPYNLYPAATIYGSASAGFSSGEAMKIMEQIAAQTLPRGTGYEWTATSYQERAAGNQIFYAFGLGLLLLYLCLAAQYESWIAPLSVILSVPLALAGPAVVFTALGGANEALIQSGLAANNLYTQIGLVLLIALSAKNAILIVEVAREVRLLHGRGIIDAALEAARARYITKNAVLNNILRGDHRLIKCVA